MIDPKAFLKAGQDFHGHKCPALPLGLRIGAAAMNALGVDRARDGQLAAILELGEAHCAHCFGDGIQMVTGCTFGKGNLRTLPYGKFGLTLVDRTTGRAVRVVPRAEVQAAQRQASFFKDYRSQGIPASAVPDEVVDPLVERVLSLSNDQLLIVGAVFDSPVERRVEAFDSFTCDQCGEMVIETYGRVVGDRKVCIPCAEAIRARAGR